MSFEHLVRDFGYAEAAAEIGVDASSPHVWIDLERAAARERDLDRVQAIHDVSWMLTQLPAERLDKLTAMRDAVKHALESEYGPRIWEFAQTRDVTLEGFVAPSAKADVTLARGVESALEFFLRKRCDVPDPVFAAVFAKCWLQRMAVTRLSTHAVDPVSRGCRTLVGVVGCDQCEQGLLRAEVDRRVEAARDAAKQQTRRAHSHGPIPPLPASLKECLLGFVGDKLACSACSGTGLDITRISQDPSLIAKCVAAGILEPHRGQLDVPKFKAAYGHAYDCDSCRGETIDAAKGQAALDTPLPDRPTRSVRDLLQAFGDDNNCRYADMVWVFGEDILCAHCSRWIDLPHDVRNGWVWPMTNGRNEICGWVRCRLGA